MENITLTRIGTERVLDLQNIGRLTFEETFSSSNNHEDMNKYLIEAFSKEKLTEELKNRESIFYLAMDNTRVIGYLKINIGDAQTEKQDINAIEIERIYVLSEYHGKKVGQLLYEQAINLAQERKATYVWLGVWEENPKAIKFYEKNGFTEFDRHVFKLGNDNQTDIMMMKFLNY